MTLKNDSNSNNSNSNSNTKYFSKPSIKFRNYFFVWSESGYGLCPSEINTLKNFVKKMIPSLEQYMNLLTFDHASISQKNVIQNKSQLCITEKHNAKVSFMLFIDNSGSTTLYREEKFFIKPEKFGNLKNSDADKLVLYSKDFTQSTLQAQDNTVVLLKWILGELLFDRIKPR